jgi:hypothetical protein
MLDPSELVDAGCCAARPVMRRLANRTGRPVIAKVVGADAASAASMQLRWPCIAQIEARPACSHHITDARQQFEYDGRSLHGQTAFAHAGTDMVCHWIVLSKRIDQRRDRISRCGLSFGFTERSALLETVR